MKTAAVALMIPAQKTRPLKVSRFYLNGLAPAEVETVRLGSNSEVGGRNREVRVTPESRLNSDVAPCLKSAKNRQSVIMTAEQGSQTEREPRGWQAEAHRRPPWEYAGRGAETVAT
jgi:hypothetical protein